MIRCELPEEPDFILGRQWFAGEFKRFERLNLSDLASGIECDEQANIIAHGTAEIVLYFIDVPDGIVLPAEYHVTAISPEVLVLPGLGRGKSNRNKLRNGQLVEGWKELWRDWLVNCRPID